eukprot:c47421_g1_i1.p1 GENE.c47421_g1_i1~~c47421_g1_i1.p1  ORF type:complete len:605 (+),score=132.87 c47421_g1_i1:42-1856(+)
MGKKDKQPIIDARVERSDSSAKRAHLKPPTRSFMYRFLVWIMRLVLKTFFRAIYVVGDDKFPETGPVIVVANHSNQFVDAMMLFVHCRKRPISFLIAEKSMHRPVIGQIARWTHAVPVVRRKDIAKKGTGSITRVLGSGATRILEGSGTAFQKEVAPGDQFEISIGPLVTDVQVVTVKRVESDTQVEVSRVEDNLAQLVSGGAKFKILPRVDHSEMFAHVVDTLERGGCIGIFPEGTSTDHTQMLDLQAGVALMALSAAARGVNVKIQAVGLNYFHGHQWRSRAALRFSDLLDVASLNLPSDQKVASGDLLKKVREYMESVTFQVPTYEIARAIHIARSIYVDSETVPLEGTLEISRRFAIAYEKFGNKPEISHLIGRVTKYAEGLHSIGVKDNAIKAAASVGRIAILFRLLFFFFEFVISSILGIVAILWTLPMITISRIKSTQEMIKAKQAAPTTKDKGLDVVASKKVVVGLVTAPIFLILYTLLALVLCLCLSHNQYIRALVPLAVLFGLPLLLQMGLVAGNVALTSRQSMRSLSAALCARPVVEQLRAEREELVHDIRAAVAKYHPDLEQDLGPRVLEFEDLARQSIRRWSVSLDPNAEL